MSIRRLKMIETDGNNSTRTTAAAATARRKI
jgi:hypothetical protein